MLGYREPRPPPRSHAKLLTILLVLCFIVSIIIYIFDPYFNNFFTSHSSRELLSDNKPVVMGPPDLPHREDIESLYNPFHDDNDEYYVANSIKAYAWLSTLVYKMVDTSKEKNNEKYEELYDQYIETFPNPDFKTISIEPENNPFNGYHHRLFYRHDSQQLSTILMVSKDETRPKHCIITFLGTTSLDDVKVDMNLGWGEIHQGMEQVAQNQMLDMNKALVEDFKMQWSDFDTITINGHSLGGGIAVITGYLLSLQPKYYKVKSTEIITFGAPKIFKENSKTGDAVEPKWKKFVDQGNKVKVLRFYHELDHVPLYPPSVPGFPKYVHFGIGIEVKESYSKTGCNKVTVMQHVNCHKMPDAYLPYINELF